MILPINKPVVTSPYGWRMLNGQKQFHDGIDFVSSSGNQTVYAVADGTVIYDMDTYEEAKRWSDQKMSGGNFVIVSHIIEDILYYARYIHLGINCVAYGQPVKQGQQLGVYADVGLSYGAHLHFDIYDSKWVKLDPTILFVKAGLL